MSDCPGCAELRAELENLTRYRQMVAREVRTLDRLRVENALLAAQVAAIVEWSKGTGVEEDVRALLGSVP